MAVDFEGLNSLELHYTHVIMQSEKINITSSIFIWYQ